MSFHNNNRPPRDPECVAWVAATTCRWPPAPDASRKMSPTFREENRAVDDLICNTRIVRTKQT
jgi:hypothetical protein